jgi:hypothetical protein
MRGARIVLAPGQRFGRYVVVRREDCRSWVCQCDCGTIKTVYGASLVKGKTSGCIKCRPKPVGSFTHGCEPLSLYQVWLGMRDRCRNPRSDSYERYGARGISVCPEWDSDFVPFRDWALAHGYRKGLTIDRVDNNSGYRPCNCRWATVAEQSINKRSTRRVEYRGVLTPIATLAQAHNIPIETLYGRIRNRWVIEDALSLPVNLSLNSKRRRAIQKQERVSR